MLDQSDIEEIAERIYGAAGHDTDITVSPLDLARALLGADAVRAVRVAGLPGRAALSRAGSGWRIHVRDGLGPVETRWAVAHELGEWAIQRNGLDRIRGLDVERLADGVGAALVAPRRAFARAVHGSGRSFDALAHTFSITVSCAVLRLGEVTRVPVALVTPQSIRYRGAPFVWPDECTLRRSRTPGGLLRRHLGERGRVAFVACDELAST